jgi:hypothetical protein
MPRPLSLAVAASVPAMVVTVAPCDRIRAAAGWAAFMWAYKIPFEIPYDRPEEMRRRLQAKKMYDALRRGEESRVRIGLTIGREMHEELNEPASPYGVLARVREKIGVDRGS